MSFNTILAARQAARLTAWKDPVVIAVDGSVTRSGLQLLQSVQLAANDRVLVTSGVYAGVWIASSNAWGRSEDTRVNGTLRNGTRIAIERGTDAGKIHKLTTANPILIGTTSQTWEVDASSSGFDAQAATTNITTSGASGTTNIGTRPGENVNIGSSTASLQVTATGDAFFVLDAVEFTCASSFAVVASDEATVSCESLGVTAVGLCGFVADVFAVSAQSGTVLSSAASPPIAETDKVKIKADVAVEINGVTANYRRVSKGNATTLAAGWTNELTGAAWTLPALSGVADGEVVRVVHSLSSGTISAAGADTINAGSGHTADTTFTLAASQSVVEFRKVSSTWRASVSANAVAGSGSSISTAGTSVDTTGDTVSVVTPGDLAATVGGIVQLNAVGAAVLEGLAGAIVTSDTGVTRIAADGNSQLLDLDASGMTATIAGAWTVGAASCTETYVGAQLVTCGDYEIDAATSWTARADVAGVEASIALESGLAQVRVGSASHRFELAGGALVETCRDAGGNVAATISYNDTACSVAFVAGLAETMGGNSSRTVTGEMELYGTAGVTIGGSASGHRERHASTGTSHTRVVKGTTGADGLQETSNAAATTYAAVGTLTQTCTTQHTTTCTGGEVEVNGATWDGNFTGASTWDGTNWTGTFSGNAILTGATITLSASPGALALASNGNTTIAAGGSVRIGTFSRVVSFCNQGLTEDRVALRYPSAVTMAAAAISTQLIVALATSGTDITLRGRYGVKPTAGGAAQIVSFEAHFENVGGTVTQVGASVITNNGASLGTLSFVISGTNILVSFTPTLATSYTGRVTEMEWS